ncbi:MAG: acyl-CoA/acyl-ACP dehydrogenase [Deltaproteobacteria bacterium]|nr:acyl-CoA/acyl-ACP dehydrogenase [Deltaproteobacteria bacterium]
MNFSLSEEQKMLQETVRGFVENECPLTRLREIFDGESDYDAALWHGLAEMGLAGLTVPEQYGGAEMEMLELALVAEVLGAGAVPSPFLGHSLATLAIQLGGDDAQKERWLPDLASGTGIATIAMGEAGGCWDPSEWQLDIEDGRLTGAKTYVTSAEISGWIVVSLVGGRLAVVAREANGVKIEPVDSADRTRRSSRVSFENTPAEVLVHPVGERVRDAGLILLAADALGGAWRLVEMSTDYAKTREQFGRKIGEFQAVKHQLANMAIQVEPGRALLWYAAHAFDHIPADAEHSAAMVKSHITDRYTQVSRDAVEIYGGIGLTWECEIHMWLKRALFDRAWLGLPQLHRERAAKLSGW